MYHGCAGDVGKPGLPVGAPSATAHPLVKRHIRLTRLAFATLLLVTLGSCDTVSVTEAPIARRDGPPPGPPPGSVPAGGAPASMVRSFAPETAARLGRELYLHDQLAWAATDALLAEVSQAELTGAGGAGWVVELSGPAPLVRFVAQRGDETPRAGWDVRFPRGGKPVVERPAYSRLLPRQALHYVASRTAQAALVAGGSPHCPVATGQPFNLVVLRDPEGPGLLVYLLRPKTAPDRVPLTGHYRVGVSADGKRVTVVEQLWRSCLEESLTVNGRRAKLIATNQVVAPTPLETYVFLSLQDRVPISVVTPDRRVWMADKGKLRLIGDAATPNAVGGKESR